MIPLFCFSDHAGRQRRRHSMMSSLIACMLMTSTAAKVSDFVLVDANTGRDIMLLFPGTTIDTAAHGDRLTVRVETDAVGGDTIRLDLDHGSTVRLGKDDPMYLAGRQADVVFPSNALVRPGQHSLRACVFDIATEPSRQLVQNDHDNSCLEVNFVTANGVSKTTKPGAAEPTIVDIPRVPATVYGAVSGELRQWHKITIGFRGPPASETGMTVPGSYRAPTPFADYRLDVSFVHSATGKKYIVPGYYAADGNAANTHAVSGSVWIVHFTPPIAGKFDWTAAFTQGTDVAIQGGGIPGHFFDGAKGSIDILTPNKKDPRDFWASKGRLVEARGAALSFADGSPFEAVVAETNQEYNILAYNQFDGAPSNSTFQETFEGHAVDFGGEKGKTFANGKGIELMGFVNHLVATGVNTLTATTLHNDQVFPFRSSDSPLYYDVSKLAQWQAVLDYATAQGLSLRIRLETDDRFDNEQDQDYHKLYYREMVARFGHNLALVWDLGGHLSGPQKAERGDLLRSLDPYGHTPFSGQGQ